MKISLPNVVEARPGFFYYRKMIGGRTRRVPLPNPTDPKFSSAYARAKAKFEKSDEDVAEGTFSRLIEEYRTSSEFLELAAETQADYERYLDLIREQWGSHPVDLLTAEAVEKRQLKLRDTPGKANAWLKVVRNLLDLGTRRAAYRISHNVAKNVKMLKGGEHQPWPEEVVEQALANADSATTRLAIEIGLYSGQRISDVIKMTHKMMEGDIMTLTQTKRRSKGERTVTVYIPIHPQWREAVARIPKRAPTLVYDRYGRSFTSTSALQERVNKLMKDLGHVGSDGKILYTFHGLRKNSSNYLMEMGLTAEEIGAINGMNADTVRHYTKGVRKRKLAENAAARVTAGDVVKGKR